MSRRQLTNTDPKDNNEENVKILFCALALGCALTVANVQSVAAAPISITTVLVGDPRPENPDNIRVNVSILGDTTSSIAWWTVDLDSALHPKARLDEFGFNLLGTASNYAFSNFNLPYTPTVGNLNGSGNTTFMLTLDDPNGNKNDATNITSLTFKLTKNTGAFTMNDFLLAPTSCSSNNWIGCNQLGAHLQALTSTYGTGSSGVSLGNYAPPPTPVPEPGTLALLGAGLVSAMTARRRRKQAV